VEGVEKITVGLTVEEASTPQSPLRAFFGARGKNDAPASKPARQSSIPKPYTVRLHLLEPDAAAKPAQRVFRVVLQGRNVLERLDPVAEAGGPMRPIVRSFPGVLLADKLTLELQSLSTRGPVLCGIELADEE